MHHGTDLERAARHGPRRVLRRGLATAAATAAMLTLSVQVLPAGAVARGVHDVARTSATSRPTAATSPLATPAAAR